jgi:hypothetical protein
MIVESNLIGWILLEIGLVVIIAGILLLTYFVGRQP